MYSKDLKNKPLVEAILEIKWHLTDSPEAKGPAQELPRVDPHYRLLLGRLFDRIHDDYPVHEPLPTATLPDEMSGHIIQHRFRVKKDQWPSIQIGPGVFTVNDTEGYKWSSFEEYSKIAITRLYDAHPSVADFHIQSVVLRYVDAVEYNYKDDDVFDFLKEKMKVHIALPDTLFNDTGVAKRPEGFSWQATFRSSKPAGSIHMSFATGEKDAKPVILWQTTVQSIGRDLPNMPDDFPQWIDAAHNIAHDWFFKLIEGELERRFQGV